MSNDPNLGSKAPRPDRDPDDTGIDEDLGTMLRRAKRAREQREEQAREDAAFERKQERLYKWGDPPE